MYQLRQSVLIHLSRFSLGINCSRIINSKSNKLCRKGEKAYIYIYIYMSDFSDFSFGFQISKNLVVLLDFLTP